MTDISIAIEHLKENGIDSIEAGGVLIVPFDFSSENDEDFYNMVSKVKSLLKEISYEKSWMVDPHYYARHATIDSDSCINPLLR